MTVLSADTTKRTNAELTADLASLGFCPEPVLDLTYGWAGGFWTIHKPEALIGNDIKLGAGDISHDFTTPWHADYHRVYGTVVFDPDYRLNGTPDLGGFDRRYGISEPKTVAERLEDIRLGVEHGRELVAKGGYFWAKYQDQVANGQMHWQGDLVASELAGHGFKRDARMFLIGTGRKQRSQKRPRNNYSTLEVWKRVEA